MKTINAAAVSLALLGGAPALAENSVISPNGSRPNVSGPAQNFTGAVVVEPLYPYKETLALDWRACHVRAGRTLRVAHASGRPSPDRDRWRGLGAGGRWREARDQAGRRGLVSSGRQALARRHRDDWSAPHRHHRHGRRQECRLDGTGHRRAVSEVRSGVGAGFCVYAHRPARQCSMSACGPVASFRCT